MKVGVFVTLAAPNVIKRGPSLIYVPIDLSKFQDFMPNFISLLAISVPSSALLTIDLIT